ncbi:MAG: hypothetical protein P1U68_11960 [Verrucomicrobiales bacterium]|nr:hypothetical protein [Verrucomicrobiales bacterium]
MKFLFRIIIASVIASGGLVGYSLTIGKDTRVGLQTQQVMDDLITLAGEGIATLQEYRSRDAAEFIEAPYQETLDACMRNMFFVKNGYHFSQSKWGAQSAPYQFRGLELIGPKGMVINQLDYAKGIDERITFEFYVEAYRSYHKSTGWKDWDVSPPPNLDSITLVLHKGTWKVAASPLKSYNLQ